MSAVRATKVWPCLVYARQLRKTWRNGAKIIFPSAGKGQSVNRIESRCATLSSEMLGWVYHQHFNSKPIATTITTHSLLFEGHCWTR